ncbi:hypothetical protein GIB23_17105 [Pseudomonas putida]|uniref:hypothetical protein n=1 Tax=Pseudomonas putida TaxID=303 RepID=UPI001A90680C|nr:hypothetical protein [Pseudomonas putida]MBO0368803.1 hypothetical protein [Pseudomonas putida]
MPGTTTAVIALTLLSQLSLLLTFFLPLKVIILLSSNGIPHYFPQSWHNLGHSRLVIALSSAAVIAYLVYFISEQAIRLCAERGAKKILARNQKITLFNDQDDIASRAYQRFVRSLAAFIFVLAASLVFAIKYPSILLLLIAYSTIACLAVSYACRYSSRFHLKLESGLGRLPSSLAGVGFLFAFSLIVVNLLREPHAEKFIAIIALLLVRQVMQRLAAIVTDVAGLMQQRLQLNALFFQGHVLVSDKASISKNLWHLLSREQRHDWLQNIFIETLGAHLHIIETRWHQTGLHDVFAFEVVTRNDKDESESQYLVKLFNNNRRELALREASLLTCQNSDLLPAPLMIAATQVNQFNCHILKWQCGIKLSARELKVKTLDFGITLISIPPTADLISRFARSRPLLPQRLDGSIVERLRLAICDTDISGHKKITEFESSLAIIKGTLQGLPLQIVNPDLTTDTLQQYQDGSLCASHWGRWTLEPIGAGWSIHELDLERLRVGFEEMRVSREDLAHVNLTDVELSALVYALERFLQRQQFLSALNLLPPILEKINAQDVVPIPD